MDWADIYLHENEEIVFLKQHSILDVFAAILMTAILYPFAYQADKVFGHKAVTLKQRTT